jgi:hypothetical protein
VSCAVLGEKDVVRVQIGVEQRVASDVPQLVLRAVCEEALLSSAEVNALGDGEPGDLLQKVGDGGEVSGFGPVVGVARVVEVVECNEMPASRANLPTRPRPKAVEVTTDLVLAALCRDPAR